MTKYELTNLDKDIYYEKLDNGLSIYIIPYEDKENYSVSYFTKYGSNYTEFIPTGKKDYVKVPDGIAHFLEHKMFETEEGVDPFTFYSKSGTDCNAFTNFNETAYIFSGTNNLYENLDYLLDYVNKPYFTDKNVEKEKGIIGEELRMYEDDPEEQLFRLMREGTYQVDPYRVEIGGSVDSIKPITKEHLYDCYNTFYTPNNMCLIVSGKCDKDEVLKVVKNNKSLSKRNNNSTIKIKEFNEPTNVTNELIEVTFPSGTKKFGFTIKLPKKNKKEDDLFKDDIILNIILKSLFGSSSEFMEVSLNKGLMTDISFGTDITNDYDSIVFMGESNKPKELIDYIKESFNKKKLTNKIFERSKKVIISNLVSSLDNIDSIIRDIEQEEIVFNKFYYDKFNIIKSITYEDVIDMLNYINFENTNTVIMNPKN